MLGFCPSVTFECTYFHYSEICYNIKNLKICYYHYLLGQEFNICYLGWGIKGGLGWGGRINLQEHYKHF